MPSYAFTARSSTTGRTVRGRRRLGSERALAQELAGEGLFLIRARPAEPEPAGRARVPARELAALLLHLATYLEAGLALLDALRDFRAPGRPGLEAAVADLAQRLAGGTSLSEAMAAHPRLFPPVQRAMVRAGETSGRLDRALRAVLDLVEGEAAWRAQLRQAATYPLILVGLLALIGVLVSTLSLPPILALLEGLGIPLPPVTRVFLGLGRFLAHSGWLLALGVLVPGLALKLALRRPRIRLGWDALLLRLPLLGPLVSRLCLARFAQVLGQQIRAGIPLLQALGESEAVTGNARMAQAVRALRAGVARGERLAVVAARDGCFPPMVVRMLAIGEETGGLEETLARTARQAEAEGLAGMRLGFQALDPLLKLALAAILVFVASAVLLPIYTLIGGLND